MRSRAPPVCTTGSVLLIKQTESQGTPPLRSDLLHAGSPFFRPGDTLVFSIVLTYVLLSRPAVRRNKNWLQQDLGDWKDTQFWGSGNAVQALTDCACISAPARWRR